MALANYGDLKDSIASWSTYTDVEDEIPDFVAWADAEIARKLRANVLLASASLTLSAETISQPTGFLALRRVYLDTTPRRSLTTVSPEAAMDMSVNYSAGTYPDAVAVEGTLLRFAPTFTGTTTTATCLYYKRPTALSDDADTNVVLTAYPYLYLFGALEALHRFKEDDDQAERFGSQFGALIESIKATEAADVMSGPLQSRPYPGGIV